MRTNIAIARPAIHTHEGAKAVHIDLMAQLHRSVMANMLFEDTFYEDGQEVSKRITDLVIKIVGPAPGNPSAVLSVIQLAIAARTQMKLRHVPLLLLSTLAKLDLPATRSLLAMGITQTIQRPDEMGELIALFWKEKKCMLPNQMKKGLVGAFKKFNEFSLAKYNSSKDAIKLRDVLFLIHAKPESGEQVDLWKRLIDGKLATPDTWEVRLSAGADKRETFERLLSEKRLGALALLRNLRNMQQSGVPDALIREGLRTMNTERVLPFRFVTAAKYAPQLEPQLEQAMFRCLSSQEKLTGKTVLIVDCSGSMHGPISAKSELDRLSAAAALAMLLREVCDDVAVYATAGDDYKRIHATMLIPPRRGFGLRDLLDYHQTSKKIGGGGIFLKQVIAHVRNAENSKADRIIVITDEQDCDLVNKPSSAKPFGKNNYLINVASAKNGIGYGDWVHIDGWSEAVVGYIQEYEGS